ncbi:hypothetical protein VP01_766g3 [Puccinia sorghi]|uniref:Uncharacterized protein n=1 Tax=Puccinia sorghi TaxID=27349 RepID=A0A0L6UDT1_9BASI|nr:hypothetical protein VP01_766g3 [Puccinia sorghi]
MTYQLLLYIYFVFDTIYINDDFFGNQQLLNIYTVKLQKASYHTKTFLKLSRCSFKLEILTPNQQFMNCLIVFLINVAICIETCLYDDLKRFSASIVSALELSTSLFQQPVSTVPLPPWAGTCKWWNLLKQGKIIGKYYLMDVNKNQLCLKLLGGLGRLEVLDLGAWVFLRTSRWLRGSGGSEGAVGVGVSGAGSGGGRGLLVRDSVLQCGTRRYWRGGWFWVLVNGCSCLMRGLELREWTHVTGVYRITSFATPQQTMLTTKFHGISKRKGLRIISQYLADADWTGSDLILVCGMQAPSTGSEVLVTGSVVFGTGSDVFATGLYGLMSEMGVQLRKRQSNLNLYRHCSMEYRLYNTQQSVMTCQRISTTFFILTWPSVQILFSSFLRLIILILDSNSLSLSTTSSSQPQVHSSTFDLVFASVPLLISQNNFLSPSVLHQPIKSSYFFLSIPVIQKVCCLLVFLSSFRMYSHTWSIPHLSCQRCESCCLVVLENGVVFHLRYNAKSTWQSYCEQMSACTRHYLQEEEVLSWQG